MVPEEHENLHKIETTPTPEKKGFTNKQKLITAISGVALTAALVIGGSIAFDKEGQKHQATPEAPVDPIEQSITNNPSANSSEATSADENPSTQTTDTETDSEKTNTTDTVKPITPTDDCPDPKAASCAIIYVDPGSGETVVTNPNQTPENVNGDDIVTLGFTKLLDIGVADDQVKKIKSDFLSYSSSQETPFTEVSITIASIRDTINEDTGERILDFTVTIDRKSKLNAEVDYVGIGNPTLKLYNLEDNTQVYSSQNKPVN